MGSRGSCGWVELTLTCCGCHLCNYYCIEWETCSFILVNMVDHEHCNHTWWHALLPKTSLSWSSSAKLWLIFHKVPLEGGGGVGLLHCLIIWVRYFQSKLMEIIQYCLSHSMYKLWQHLMHVYATKVVPMLFPPSKTDFRGIWLELIGNQLIVPSMG